MKMKLLLAMACLLFSTGIAQAQYPQGPNAGFANTPYNTDLFGITFNGTVRTTNYTNPTNSNVDYISADHGVTEEVIVRTIDHTIPVDFSSSDYYVNHFCNDANGNVIGDCTRDTTIDINHNSWDSHPFSYGFYYETINGVKQAIRMRVIIVNSRTVLFLQQTAPIVDKNHQDEWLDFEYSLRIHQ